MLARAWHALGDHDDVPFGAAPAPANSAASTIAATAREVAAATVGPGRHHGVMDEANLDLERETLATYGSLGRGFVTYGELTDEDKRNLTNLINALAEPLSQLTSTILQ